MVQGARTRFAAVPDDAPLTTTISKEIRMKVRPALATLIATCATICILMPSVAQAANTTCANADFLFLNERASYFIAGSSNLYFKANVVAGRSYAVMTWGPFQDVGEGGVSLGVDLYSDNGCTTGAGGANATDYEPFLFGIIGHSADHDNIIPTSTGPIYIRVNNSIASGYTVHVVIVETTIFSPWWFTGGTNQAYVEVRNNMNSSTTAELTVYAPNGTVCGTSSPVISGNGNTAIEIGGLGTCGGTVSGSAQIAFAGTPGGVVANITTINVPNGTSFDSPFAPRMVWGGFSR
jgi:hypothetical protein